MLHPFDLPPDFMLVHNFNITYQVYVTYNRDDGEEVVKTEIVPGDRNYLNLDVLDACKRYKFAVKAVINDELYSEISSFVSDIRGEYS